MKKIVLLCLLLPVLVRGDSIDGDINGDGVVDIGDVVFQIDYLYHGGAAPNPPGAGDVNGDSSTNLSDAAYLADLILGGSDLPVEPDSLVTESTAYDILFIGSSYFAYNDLPGMMRDLIASRDKTVNIETAITSGLYLADHVGLASTEAKINEREWDYVILQGVGRLVAYPDSLPNDHPVYPALVILRDKIRLNCASTKMVFCMPWAFEDGMTWLPGWTDDYAEMQLKVYDNTLIYSNEIGFVIAPVGWAWNTVLREQGYPLHYLHLSDWNHPSLKGSYLMACAIYSTIYQESTVGTGYSAGLPKVEAAYFQDVASNTVLDNLELWNIVKRVIPPPAERESLGEYD